MKKIILITICLMVLIIGKLSAQIIYADAGAGYNFRLAAQNLVYYTTPTTKEIKKVNYGNGVDFGGGAGYMFNKYIGAEVDFSYLISNRFSYTNRYADDDSSSQRIDATMFRVIPAVKFSLGNKIKPYSKIGLVLGFGKLIKTDAYTIQPGPGPIDFSRVEETKVYTGNISLGVMGVLGVDIMFTDNIGVYVEMKAIAQSWAPKKSVYTMIKLDGVDHIQSMNNKETIYVDSIDNTQPYTPGEPFRELKTWYPFSSWGFNAGVHLAFACKSKKTE